MKIGEPLSAPAPALSTAAHAHHASFESLQHLRLRPESLALCIPVAPVCHAPVLGVRFPKTRPAPVNPPPATRNLTRLTPTALPADRDKFRCS